MKATMIQNLQFSVTAKPVVKSMEPRLVLVQLSRKKDSKSFQEKPHWWDTNPLQGKNVFFSNCGTHLYATSSKKPENIILRIGCIDGNHNIVPTRHIWISQKASWYEITENIPMHEEW